MPEEFQKGKEKRFFKKYTNELEAQINSDDKKVKINQVKNLLKTRD